MDVQAKPCYKRILLKLSGEALMGEDSFGINRAVLQHMIEELRTCLLYTSPSPRDYAASRMPSSA